MQKASASGDHGKLVKIADKICNLRDLLASPPADWSLARGQPYFDWAKEVRDRIHGLHPDLERRFRRTVAFLTLHCGLPYNLRRHYI